METISTKNKHNKGSAIYFAVLIVSIFLALSLAITSVAVKETQFSIFGRESQEAFYAADTGVECALHWDYIGYNPNSAFPSNSSGAAQNINCLNSGSFTPTIIASNSTSAISEFYIKMDPVNDNASCVRVEIRKEEISNNNFRTIIEAFGVSASDKSVSTCAAAPEQIRRVERAIRVQYGG